MRKNLKAAMNTLKNVEAVLRTKLKKYRKLDYFQMVARENVSGSHLRGALYNLVTDTTQNPDNILQLLDSFLPGLDGFSECRHYQNLVAFFCLLALAKRRPVLVGTWEKVVYISAKYARYTVFLSFQWEKMSDYEDIGEKVMRRIQKLCSPNLCPNPYLKLELIRLSGHFSPVFGDIEYERESYRELAIDAICDIHDRYSTQKMHQFQMSACDFEKVMARNSIDIRNIMLRDHPESKRIKIIGALITITGIFAHLEKERGLQRSNDEGLQVCINFCGLIPDYDQQLKSHIPYFIKAIGDKPFLLDSVIDTFDIIKDASLMLGLLYDDYGKPCHYVTELLDMILYMFYKHYIGILPKQKVLGELNGGYTPAVMSRIKYFYNDLRPSTVKLYNEYKNYNPGPEDDCYRLHE